ncbi:MAG: hypothetical protein DMG30_23505 [Acidobacteria bacterium]|nr:MAG: hypothetical protein DMG30_23505 [Acidobacteriota bacterium]
MDGHKTVRGSSGPVTKAAGTPCTPGLGLPQCPGGNINLFDRNHNDLPNQSSGALLYLDLFGNTRTLKKGRDYGGYRDANAGGRPPLQAALDQAPNG